MTSRETITYATATAQDLLEAIPDYEAQGCDFATISIAWMRYLSTSASLGDFKVKGLPFRTLNFSAVHLILLPLAREEDGRRTLAPFAAFLRANEITHIRVIGSGMSDRRHQYTRDHGKTWGNIPLQQKPPHPPAPTQVLDAPIPPPPAPDDDRPLWD
ncbi:hypothetical protein [uncultured Deinococcus sp.]|uniref:hypothetical protein n=1 Tax=uncultured Deinococcus sp. TaxID=158789 RepID=UPI00258EC055|nr:hypothetical protein [uncultured Deinococcus sp.]